MSDRLLKLLLVERDPIFRTGLRLVVEQFLPAQVAAQAENGNAALRALAKLSENSTAAAKTIPVDLVVLELDLDDAQSSQKSGLQLCWQLKTQYPDLPILVLSTIREPTLLAEARQAGVNGYCPKGIPVSELVAAIQLVATGRSYWVEEPEVRTQTLRNQREASNPAPSPNPLTKFWARLRLSGLRQIDVTLIEVTAQLQVPGLPLLDRAILAGQRRELLAARWLVNQLLAVRMTQAASPHPTHTVPELPHDSNLPNSTVRDRIERKDAVPLPLLNPLSSELTLKNGQAALFDATLTKLQFSLQNLTRVPLEIDILREEKKRELLCLVLRKVEAVLEELRFSQVEPSQLHELQPVILRDLWQAVTTDFFGKYATIRLGKQELEIVNSLLQDFAVVQAILDRIPLFVDLLNYILFQTALVIDNVPYASSSPEAMERGEALLQNLLIQVANGVVQPLLNQFSDVEAIKQSFYDRRLISTREIERFRNDLSWKYRLENYIEQPKAIFESRYELFVLASRGIAKISIYAPRVQELAQLSGIQLAVTLALETRDAIAPRLRAAVEFLGSGIVYVLSQVIGRAIGLIGRGILQSIGGSVPERKFGKNSERPK